MSGWDTGACAVGLTCALGAATHSVAEPG